MILELERAKKRPYPSVNFNLEFRREDLFENYMCNISQTKGTTLTIYPNRVETIAAFRPLEPILPPKNIPKKTSERTHFANPAAGRPGTKPVTIITQKSSEITFTKHPLESTPELGTPPLYNQQSLTYPDKKREYIVKELLQTEKAYVSTLERAITVLKT